MKAIDAYMTVDGKVFLNEKEAITHEDDLLGETIDELFLHVFKLDINRYSQHGAILKAMKERETLKQSINMLYNILNHAPDGE